MDCRIETREDCKWINVATKDRKILENYDRSLPQRTQLVKEIFPFVAIRAHLVCFMVPQGCWIRYVVIYVQAHSTTVHNLGVAAENLVRCATCPIYAEWNLNVVSVENNVTFGIRLKPALFHPRTI